MVKITRQNSKPTRSKVIDIPLGATIEIVAINGQSNAPDGVFTKSYPGLFKVGSGTWFNQEQDVTWQPVDLDIMVTRR